MKWNYKQFGLFLLILFFALLIRVLFIRSVVDRDWPFSVFYYGDSHHYHLYAMALIEGELYDQGIPFHPPFYAWFLSAIYKILGPPVNSGYPYKFWMAVINSITVAFTWLWWRKTIGELSALIGAALLCFHFGWLLFSATFANEVLYCLFLSATAGLLWLRATTFSWRDATALGVLTGVAALTRGEHSSLWPFFLLYLWIQRDRTVSMNNHFARWGLAVAISLLVLIPTTIRNWKVLGAHNQRTAHLEPLSTFVTVTSYGPVNFALANSDSADGGFTPELISKLDGGGGINMENAGHRKLYIHGYSIGIAWIKENPGRACQLFLRKFNRWLDGLRIGFGVSNFPGGLSGNRPPVDLFIPDPQRIKWPRALIVAIGIFFSLKKEYRAFSICTLILLHRLILTELFFGYARGLVVMLPVIIPLALLPLIVASSKWPVVKKVAGVVTIVAVILFTLQALEIATGPPRNFQASGSSDNRGKIIQDDWVKIWPATN
ncbi:glycosyltransferase family 39 protein [bacterium]|nr:glycosyltransferase family 39 protein [bacterium]MCI0604228.1 glycosyltransferase family 39 protein [bacterium]